MERLLDKKPDNSFQPPLTRITRLLQSIDFDDADPSVWNARFKNRKVELVALAPSVSCLLELQSGSQRSGCARDNDRGKFPQVGSAQIG